MRPSIRSSPRECCAVIDLGSNTCLLLIVEWDGSRLVPLVEELRVVRLGTGVDQTGRISDEAIERAVSAFHDYRDIIEKYECRQVRPVATSAFRDAANRQALFQRLRHATGYELDKISGREEGQLVLRAVQHDFPLQDGRRVIVDVGGGSTEIIIEQQGQLKALESLPLGVVRITERWLPSDPPERAELQAAQEEIERLIAQSDLPRAAETMVAVGGTPTTFAAMDLQLETYDPVRVHGAILTTDTLQRMIAQCLDLPLEQRRQLPGLHPGRADVIIAGGLILQAVLDRFGLGQLTVSDRGLRWGVALEMLHREDHPTSTRS